MKTEGWNSGWIFQWIRERKKPISIFFAGGVFLLVVLIAGIIRFDGDCGYGKADFAVFYVAGGAITNTFDLVPSDLYGTKKMNPILNEIRCFPSGYRFLYLPQAAVLFAPFTVLNFDSMARVWAMLNILSFIGMYYLGIRMLGEDWRRIRYSVLLCILLFSDSFSEVIRTGQINAVVGLLLLGSFVLVQKKKNTSSGLLVSLATSLKIFPIIYLPYFAIRKQWKVFGSMIGGIGTLFLISIPFFGAESWGNFLSNTFFGLIFEGASGSLSDNPSLYGTFLRSLEEGIGFFSGVNGEIALLWGNWIHLGILIITGAVVGWIIWKNRAKESAGIYLYEYGLIMLFFLLFARGGHRQYAIWIIPSLLVFLRLPFTWKNMPSHVFAAAILLLTQFWGLFPVDQSDGIFFYIIHPLTIGFLLLFAVMLLVQTRMGKSDILPMATRITEDDVKKKRYLS